MEDDNLTFASPNDKLKCPYCGEMVKPADRKCPHCLEWLPGHFFFALKTKFKNLLLPLLYWSLLIYAILAGISILVFIFFFWDTLKSLF